MAVPKKKKSKSKRDMRRAHDHIKMPNVSSCPQCHEAVLSHNVCKSCGTYKGQTIIETKEEI
jgi:large subunit ribosomal protein L32